MMKAIGATMIISCEQCSTRFQVPDDRITDAGVKARCSRCGHVFLVTKATASSATLAGASPASANPSPSSARPSTASPSHPFAPSQPFSATPLDRKTQPFPFGGGIASGGANDNPFLRAGLGAPAFAAPSDVAPTPGAAISSTAPAAPRAPTLAGAPIFGSAAQPPFSSTPFSSMAGAAAAPPTPSVVTGSRPGTPREGTPRQTVQHAHGSPSGHLSASSFPRPSSTGMKKLDAVTSAPADPFAAAAFPRPPSSTSISDPFAPPPGNPFGSSASPFGVPSTPSRFGPAAGAAGFDDGGGPSMPADPFRVPPSSNDPFSGGALGAPFDAQRALDPFATTPPLEATRAAQNALADELFSDPSLLPRSSTHEAETEVPFGFDSLRPNEESVGFGALPSGELPATSIHDVPDILREAARPEPLKAKVAKRRRRPLTVILRPAVKPLVSLANVVVLVAFLIIAVVVARGGGLRDIVDGHLFEILLGARGGVAQGGTLVARDVVVRRYPVPAARDLVVVTGMIENTGDEAIADAVIEVTFAEGARTFTGVPGAPESPFDLLRAKDMTALMTMRARRQAEPIPAHGAAPFMVIAAHADDGARATVTLRDPRARGVAGGS
jgi:predicted Zn finger-like uncharacterized protein